MNVIVACEESQAVCKAFRLRGHNAFSCDIKPCSGGHPEWHIIGDCFELFNGGLFVCEDGSLVEIKCWDLLIGHPPCTFLSVVANDYFNEEKYEDAFLRKLLRAEAISFFLLMFDCGIKRICLENPVGFVNTLIKPTQIIHPKYFGDSDNKRTCLWLKNLSRLVHIKQDDFFDKKTHVEVKPIYIRSDGKPIYFTDAISGGTAKSQELRSKTFQGIADAMANQWS